MTPFENVDNWVFFNISINAKLGDLMCCSRMIVLMSLVLFGCINAPSPQSAPESGIVLSVEKAEIEHSKNGRSGLVVTVRTVNQSEQTLCELAPWGVEVIEPPTAFFIFTDGDGREIFSSIEPPQLYEPGSDLDTASHFIERREAGSVSVDKFLVLGDVEPMSLSQGGDIRVKAARFVFPCTYETGELLPTNYPTSDQADQNAMDRIFSHFRDRLIFSPEYSIEAVQ